MLVTEETEPCGVGPAVENGSSLTAEVAGHALSGSRSGTHHLYGRKKEDPAVAVKPKVGCLGVGAGGGEHVFDLLCFEFFLFL